MKNKITTSLIVFLLLIPLRLPISILFIHFFQWLIGMTTKEVIPDGILATNVIVTKLVYNIALSAFFIYTIEVFSREKYGRKARMYDSIYKKYDDSIMYWWIVPIGILLLSFIIIDAISVYDIFFITKH